MSTPKRSPVSSPKTRSPRDRKARSPMSKYRSTTSSKSPLRWTPQRKVHTCLPYTSTTKGSEKPRGASRERNESGLIGKKTGKDCTPCGSTRPRNLDTSLDWKDLELRGKKPEIDSATYSAYSSRSRELDFKKPEIDSATYSAYSSKSRELDTFESFDSHPGLINSNMDGTGLSAYKSRSKTLRNLDGSLEWRDSEETKAANLSLDEKLLVGHSDSSLSAHKYINTANGIDVDIMTSNRKVNGCNGQFVLVVFRYCC